MLNTPVNGNIQAIFKAFEFFFTVLFKANFYFSRTFQDSPVYSSTFQACAKPVILWCVKEMSRGVVSFTHQKRMFYRQFSKWFILK